MIDQLTASQIGFGQAKVTQANAGSSLIVSSQLALPDETWLVDSCSLMGIDPTAISHFPNPGLSGLFLCPAGTAQAPNILVGDPTGKLVQQLLGLPTDGAGSFWSTSETAETFWQTHTTKEFVVPPNCFIMGVWESGAGAFPANGSTLQLNFTYARRKVCAC